MIGAMPAVAVRHERRKGQEKRSKRPSQLFIGGHWLPPTSPSPTPSPGGLDDRLDRLPELYLCGKVSALQIVVGCILLGAIVLIVGLVQLVPNAADADHRYLFIGAGVALLLTGFIMTAVRCFCMHCARNARVVVMEEAPPPPAPLADATTLAGSGAVLAVNSIDVLMQQRRDTIVSGSGGDGDEGSNEKKKKKEQQQQEHQQQHHKNQHHQHHHHHHHHHLKHVVDVQSPTEVDALIKHENGDDEEDGIKTTES